MKLINLFVSLLRGPSTHLSEKINTMSLQFDVSKYIIAQIYHCCCLSADLRALFFYFFSSNLLLPHREQRFLHTPSSSKSLVPISSSYVCIFTWFAYRWPLTSGNTTPWEREMFRWQAHSWAAERFYTQTGIICISCSAQKDRATKYTL